MKNFYILLLKLYCTVIRQYAPALIKIPIIIVTTIVRILLMRVMMTMMMMTMIN